MAGIEHFLLRNISTNITGEPVECYGAAKAIEVYAETWGGAKVTIQVKAAADDVWLDLDYDDQPYIFISNKFKTMDFIPQARQIRAVVTDATGTTANITARIS